VEIWELSAASKSGTPLRATNGRATPAGSRAWRRRSARTAYSRYAAAPNYTAGPRSWRSSAGQRKDLQHGRRQARVRHNLANVLFTAVTPDQALVSCYFTVVTHIGSIISAATATPWCPSRHLADQAPQVSTDWRPRVSHGSALARLGRPALRERHPRHDGDVAW